MPTYYVGPGGNDGNSGLTWALRKLTLNGAEDVPVVAGDTIYVGPGVYREQLVVDVSGNAGNPITYIGDVAGANTDGVGGPVRITGSNNDQVAVRATCITDASIQRDYRTFRGFALDTATVLINAATDGGTNWIVEDCTFQHGETGSIGIYVSGLDQANWMVRRCVFSSGQAGTTTSVQFAKTGAPGINAGHTIENCVFRGGDRHIYSSNVGLITVRHCFLVYSDQAVRVTLAGANPLTMNNCIFAFNNVAVWAAVLGELVENYNTFYGNATDRTNVAIGANSVTYPPLLDLGLRHAGAGQASGFHFPQPLLGTLSQWSQVRAINDTGPATLDLTGLTRPVTLGKRSWGAVQYVPMVRDTGTVQGGAASLELSDAGRVQFKIPVTAVATTVSVYAYREANYAGNNPQMIVKQPGQADRTTTDAGAAGAWNQLTDTFTPAATPGYIFIELVSRNTAAAGAYATYFDTLTVSVNTSLGLMETWLWDRSVADWVQNVPAGAGAVSISPLRGGLGG